MPRTPVTPDPHVPVRKRRGGQRSRSGCLPCKTSHVQCSEEKPKCRRCERRKLVCIYTADAKPPAPIAVPLRTRILPAPVAGLSLHRVSDLKFESSLEADYFAYFRSHVIPNMDIQSYGGYSNFWLRTVLREAERNDGVRNFVVGIAAVGRFTAVLGHSGGLKSSNIPWKSDYYHALRFYTKAIAIFREQVAEELNPIEPRTFLIYCVLQATYEGLQGNRAGLRNAYHTGFEVLKHRLMQDDMTVAAPLDDEGIAEAEVLLSRSVAVDDLAGIRCSAVPTKAPIAITVPIKIQIPSPATPTISYNCAFNAFFSRAIVWMLEVTAFAQREGGLRNAERVFRELGIVIGQMQEWVTALSGRAASTTAYLDRARLRAHEVEARFGVVFLLCFQHRRTFAAYSDQCLEMLSISRETVEIIRQNDATRSPLSRAVLAPKVMGMVNRIVESCPDAEVRRVGLEILTMITVYSEITVSSTFFEAYLDPSTLDDPGADDSFKDGDKFDPEARYFIDGYSWDEKREVFRVSLRRSTKDASQKIITASYAKLMDPAEHGQESPI